jgi:four helix bundle protein
MRDHKKLRAFELADALAMEVYRATAGFLQDERYGLTAQMRRAAVSVASNIVEGCARHSEADYVHFLHIAYGSARELEYQISLAYQLGFLGGEIYSKITATCAETCRVLNGLIRSIRN